MAFLTPAFFLGLGAIAIPVLIHLIQREKKRVVEFPSLMFVRRIPYQSVRRRRIRHWLLLLVRAAAMALIAVAFARPFVRRNSVIAAAGDAARDVVILLDQSASMGYGDHWEKARTGARRVVDGLGAGDRATLVLFAKNAEERVRATSDRAQLDRAIDAAKVTAGATRYGPALKLAASILGRSPLTRREAVLISDFQKSGWTGSEDARFPDGMTLATYPVGEPKTANLAVRSVTFGRSAFSGQERIAVTAGLSNKGDEPLKAVPVSLAVDGHELEALGAAVAPHAAASVTFAPFTLAGANVRGFVRAGTDPLPSDNTFHFVLTPSEPVSLLVVDNGAPDASLYISKALAIGAAPRFQVDVTPAGRVAPASFDKRAVVVLNDTRFPPAASGGVLKRFVERGGGLLVVAGDHTTFPAGSTSDADLLPGRLGTAIDRTDGRAGSLGFLDYSHQVFELFKAPRSGDFSAARFFRYRSVEPSPADRVLARFDDGAVAAAERKIGAGRVIVWTSTLDDSLGDIGVKPVFLPLVHQLVRYLAHDEPLAPWLTVGQVLDAAARAVGRTDRIVVTPSGERIAVDSPGSRDSQRSRGSSGLVELTEQGVYEIRSAGATAGRPESVAVNIDPVESDLTPLDPRELVAEVTGHATPESAEPAMAEQLTREEMEKRQGLWWYLLFTGMMLLAVETFVSNRLSRKEKFL